MKFEVDILPVKKISGKNHEYRRCLSCCEYWDANPDTTNKCPACGGKNSLYMSEFIPDKIFNK